MSKLPAHFVRSFRAPTAKKSRDRRPRLAVHSLEDRTVPTTFTVTTAAGDTSPGSLGDAINLANLTPGPDTINFDTTGTFATPQTITLTAALPTITDDLTITGDGVASLAVDGAGQFQIFNSSATHLAMSNFTVTGGFAASANGGGLLASGTVVVGDMVFTNNRATGDAFNAGSGGAIALHSNSSLTVSDTTISGNTAQRDGGGIYFYFNGSLSVTGSTLSGNQTTDTKNYTGGAAIYLYGAASTFQIVNSTIAGNTTASSGGGIKVTRFSGTILIQDSTISGNASTTTASGYGGGGIYGGPLVIQNSVISGNTNQNAPDIYSYSTVGLYSSAVGSTTGFTPSGSYLVGDPATLGLDTNLADNGGPTQTLRLLPGSQLIDAGDNTLIPAGTTTDQRGELRVFNGTVDIGAVEDQPPGVPFASGTGPTVTATGGASYTFTVTYSDPNGTNNGINTNTILTNPDTAVTVAGPNGFTAGASLVSVSGPVDGQPQFADYSITPPGGAWAPQANGTYTIRVNGGLILDLDGNAVQAGSVGTFQVAIPQTFVVTNADDSGPGSLRDAITAANGSIGDDMIVFDPTVFATPQTITLQSALAQFSANSGSLTIDGPGAADLTVNGGGTYQVFNSAAPSLTISGVTVTGGSAVNGGGIEVASGASLFLSNSTVSGNSATGGGGGIYVADSGYLSLTNDTISGNTAAGPGGGIDQRAHGTVVVQSTTVSGNSATTAGGGIYLGNAGSLFVIDSTVSGNSTTSASGPGGGGIYFYGYAYPILIQDSTIANNHSASSGGGVEVNTFTGTLQVVGSTISGNTAAATTSGAGGGGIFDSNGGGTITIQNSVISGNTNANAQDVLSTGTVNEYSSLITDANGFTPSGSSSGNLTAGTVAKLGPLQDNGGPTLTMAPQAGSPLIDAGDNTLVPAGDLTDQRGFDRLDPITGTVDIGAVEVQPAIPTITVDPAQADPTNDTTQVVFDVTFDQPVTGFDASQIDFTGSTDAGSLTASVSQIDGSHYTVTVTGITGDGDVVATVLAGTGTEGVNGSGQPNAASAGSATVTIDTTAPTVTVEQGGLQADPTNANPIVFEVQFSEPVAGFGPSAVTLGGTLAGVASVTGVVPGLAPGSYVVEVTVAGSQTGTITASVDAGAVTDLAGNPNDASTSTDNSVTFDNIAPTVTVALGAGQAATAGGSSVVFDVTFSEPVPAFSAAAVDLAGTTAAGATVGVTNSGDDMHFTVTVSGMTGSGTVDVTVDNGAVQDPAGNDNIASNTASVSFTDSGTVQFSAPTYTVNEAGAPTLSVVVTRTGGSDGLLSVDYATANGTAVAGTDYTDEHGTLSWGAGVATSQTILIPILDDGGFEADSAFTVGLSNISLSGALGSPSSATVTINEEAGLTFSAATYNTAEGAGFVTVTVQRPFDTAGAVSVDYATSDGTATAGSDYTAESGTLSWLSGDNTDRTFTIPIIEDTVNEGRETINLTLSNATGNALIGPQGTATVVIAPSDGVTVLGAPPKGQKSSATITDADGDQVTVALGGKVGTLTYYLTNGTGPISEIDLAGTDPAKSTVSITVKKPKDGTGDGRVGLGEVDGTGFKSFTAKTSDLIGAGFNLSGFAGFAGTISIGNVENGADFLLAGSQPTLKSATTITAGVIGDGTDINVTGPVKSITAIAIGQGTIEAPSIGAIKVKGQKATKVLPAIPGDFQSAVTISGLNVDPVKGKALGSLSVAGAVSGATISVGGNVGLVNVGSFVDSNLFAGYSGPTSGTGTFTGLFTVGPFVTHAAAGSFHDSYVIADNIKSVNLSSVDTANGGTPFGFDFHGTFGGLTAKSPKLTYNKKTGGSQLLAGDFGVQKV